MKKEDRPTFRLAETALQLPPKPGIKAAVRALAADGNLAQKERINFLSLQVAASAHLGASGKPVMTRTFNRQPG